MEVTVDDINDSAPRFTDDMYVVPVSEDEQPDDVITTMVARDLDTVGTLQYSIQDGADSKFTIDPVTGNVPSRALCYCVHVYSRIQVMCLPKTFDNACHIITLSSWSTNVGWSWMKAARHGLCSSGDIIVLSVLDREDVSEYLLTVAAHDGQQGTTTRVKIMLDDVNDDAPHFLLDAYYFDVPENSATGD